jgi:DNA mismatch endonuclease, patch repair protein
VRKAPLASPEFTSPHAAFALRTLGGKRVRKRFGRKARRGRTRRCPGLRLRESRGQLATSRTEIRDMADAISKAKRSKIMAAVRSKGNKDTELRLISILRRHQITGWRRGSKLPGRPDFVFQSRRLAVFVDGCFWHGCRWHCRRGASNKRFWDQKLAVNKARDDTVNKLLKSRKWTVLRIWEHALADEEKVVARLHAAISKPLPNRLERARSRK